MGEDQRAAGTCQNPISTKRENERSQELSLVIYILIKYLLIFCRYSHFQSDHLSRIFCFWNWRSGFEEIEEGGFLSSAIFLSLHEIDV